MELSLGVDMKECVGGDSRLTCRDTGVQYCHGPGPITC